MAKVTSLNRPSDLTASRKRLKGSFLSGAVTSPGYKTPEELVSGPQTTHTLQSSPAEGNHRGVSSRPACHVCTRQTGGRSLRSERLVLLGEGRHHIQGRYLRLKTGERQLFHTFAFISTFSLFREPRAAAAPSTLGRGRHRPRARTGSPCGDAARGSAAAGGRGLPQRCVRLSNKHRWRLEPKRERLKQCLETSH